MSHEPRSAPHVLVVDDELLIRWALTQALTARGATVVEAADAAAAIAAVRADGAFDAAVLDVNLPDCQDLRLVTFIRRVSPATRIILMSAFGTPALRDDARAIGVGFVDKPFDLETMAGLVLPAGSAA